MDKYTVWVWAPLVEDRGTHYITCVEAQGIPQAKDIALQECHEAWDGCYEPQSLQVLGVAAGDVEILEWKETEE